jgi:hypothetical protein
VNRMEYREFLEQKGQIGTAATITVEEGEEDE